MNSKMAYKKKTNWFERIPEQSVIQIMKSCDVTSMLTMCEVSKQFNEQLATTTSLKKRILLKVDFVSRRLLPFDPIYMASTDIERLHRTVSESTRQYMKLRLRHIDAIFMAANQQILPRALEVVTMLGPPVIDLRIEMYSELLEKDMLRVLMNMPNLKKLRIVNVQWSYEERLQVLTPNKQLIVELQCPDFNFLANIEELSISHYSFSILKLFNGRKLKKLQLNFGFQRVKYLETLENFMTKQPELEELTVCHWTNALPWISQKWLSFPFKLKFFCFHQRLVKMEIAHFFKIQNQLESLSFTMSHQDMDQPHTLHEIFKAILGLPKLKRLHIKWELQAVELPKPAIPSWFFAGLSNTIIEECELVLPWSNFLPLLNCFKGIKKVKLFGRTNLSLLDLRILDIVELQGYHFHYQPAGIPQDAQLFEAVALNFVKRNSQVLSIYVGHPDWLQTPEFQLSIDFCKAIALAAPRLQHIKLYNVHDTLIELYTFLEDADIATLGVIELQTKFEEDDEVDPFVPHFR